MKYKNNEIKQKTLNFSDVDNYNDDIILFEKFFY